MKKTNSQNLKKGLKQEVESCSDGLKTAHSQQKQEGRVDDKTSKVMNALFHEKSADNTQFDMSNLQGTNYEEGYEKGKKELKDKILDFHKLVVTGLVNGLSHTERDGRTEELEFWKQRSILFDRFGHCVMNLITDQSYELDFKELKEIAEAGYNENN